MEAPPPPTLVLCLPLLLQNPLMMSHSCSGSSKEGPCVGVGPVGIARALTCLWAPP